MKCRDERGEEEWLGEGGRERGEGGRERGEGRGGGKEEKKEGTDRGFGRRKKMEREREKERRKEEKYVWREGGRGERVKEGEGGA